MIGYKQKKGMTLVEVMIATVLVGIISALMGAYIVSVHKERMDARLWRAAVLQAESAMETAFFAVAEYRSDITDTHYLNITNSAGKTTYSIVNQNPGLKWEYDGVWRDYEIYIDGTVSPVAIRVQVTHVNNRVIDLRSERYKDVQ